MPGIACTIYFVLGPSELFTWAEFSRGHGGQQLFKGQAHLNYSHPSSISEKKTTQTEKT